MKQTVLITGVAGLIGSKLSQWLIDNISDINVIGIDDLSGGYMENVPKEVIFFKEDVKNVEISDIFNETKPNYVFHLAAYAAEGLSPFIRCFNYQNNLIATANIVNECIKHNIKRLVFTSSLAVYGNGNPPFDENDIPNPIDPYGVAKLACEKDIQIAGEQHGLDWCIIRPHNVYGTNQNIWDKYRNVLGIWMYQHLNNMPMTIFGDGEQQRAFSCVDDCMESFWKAATIDEASKEIINVGGTKPYTINEANKILTEIFGSGSTLYQEARHEVKNAHPTWQKSADILGYVDKTDLKNGLLEMWKWAQTQPKRNQFIWNKYELDKGMYSFWKNN
jgi:UDP-glucose 4-epimerase